VQLRESVRNLAKRVERGSLDLPDPLAREPEVRGNALQRLGHTAAETEATTQDLTLPPVQATQQPAGERTLLEQRSAHRAPPGALITATSVRGVRSMAGPTGGSAPEGSDSSAPALKTGLRVLVAEDNLTNQIIVEHLLQKLGCQVVVAATGVEALDRLSEDRFDLVLMDCQMPELDGYEATRRLRASAGENRDVPVIALTANAVAGDRERCLAAGMNDHLTKPIGLAELQAGLERWSRDLDESETTG